MRILHTSDWHLGQTWSGRSRKKEFDGFLEWLLQTLQTHAVDVLIVAGDVFDISAPTNETQKTYFQFLKKVSKKCPHTVIVSGNHDSASLLDVPQPFLSECGIHVIGVATEPEKELIVLRNDNTAGPPQLMVAAVPFLRDRDIRRAVEGETLAESENRFIAGIKAHYEAVCAAAEKIRGENPGHDIPLMATGHLFVAGISSPGMIREIHVGTLGQLGCDIFPPSVDYVALGHIHRPSKIGGRDNVRYSGSPIPMNFDEAAQEKSVVLVEFDGRTPRTEIIPVPRFSNIQRIEGDLKTIQARLTELENALKTDSRDCFVEVVYTGAEPLHDLVQQVEDYVKEGKIEIVRISNERDKSENRWNLGAEDNLDQLTELEVFERLLEDDEKNRPPHDEHFRRQLLMTYREVVEQCLSE